MINIPENKALKIIGNPVTKPGGLAGRLICFVIVTYSLLFIAQNPVVLASAIKDEFRPMGQVLGVSSTGGSNVTFGSTLDSNFNLALKGVLNAGGISGVNYNAFAISGQTPTKTSITTSNDLFIGGDLEVAGTINSTGSLNIRGTSNPLFQLESTSTAIPPKVQLINANGNQWHFGAFGSVDKFSFARTGIRDVFIADNSGSNIILTLDPGSGGSTLFPNGNLGIGTATPGARLDITGSFPTPNAQLRLRDRTYGYWDIAALYNFTNPDLVFYANGTEKLRFNANGQVCIGYNQANCGTTSYSLLTSGAVGIGTNTPLSRLHVQDSVGTTVTIGNPSVINNDSADGAIKIYGEQSGLVKYGLINQTGSNLQINAQNGGTNLQFYSNTLNQFISGIPTAFLDSSNTKWLQIQHDGSNAIISTVNNGAGGIIFKPVTNITTAMQFENAAGSSTILDVDTTNSSVGVNTTTPNPTSFGGGALSIKGSSSNTTGNVQAIGNSLTGTNPIGRLAFTHSYSSTNTDVGVIEALRASADDAADFRIRLRSTGGSLTDYFHILSTGQVGIGNISPVGKLDVSGAVTGKALAMFNETGDQALFTASASGVAKFTIQHSGLVDATADGLATKVVAGAVSDGSFSGTVVDGLHAIDSADGRFYFRYGGAWHYVAQTAGFQIPDYETFAYDFDTHSFDTNKPLADGDFLVPFVEKRLSDGAVHGLYARLTDVLETILKEIKFQVTFLSKVIFKDEVIVSSDTAGTVKINAGQNKIDVTFQKEYSNKPVINITPLGNYDTKYWVSGVTNKGFTIEISGSLPADIEFSWTALSLNTQ